MLSRIIFIGDSKRYAPLLNALSDLGIKVDHSWPAGAGFTNETVKPYSAMIVDWHVHPSERQTTLNQIRKLTAKLPVIGLVAGSDVSKASLGATGKLVDYVAITGDQRKDLDCLLESLKRFVPVLRSRILGTADLLLINTPNVKMKEILALVDIIKDEPSSVLIQGENGTGKEIIARLLHFSGRRYTGPFVTLNCAAIPETLLESELFGHEKGSYTGATGTRIGKFELADRGTIFLDEIGDMPLNTQAKILRVLERAEIERLGGSEKIPVDIRIVTATNKNLAQQIEKEQFRQDLYFRINTFTITIPPLRERREDVLPLACHFLDLQAKRKRSSKKHLSGEAEQLLLSHNWPGNVRELRNAMERAFVLTAGNTITPEVLPEEIRNQSGHDAYSRPPLPAAIPEETALSLLPLKDLERQSIINTLRRLNNNVTKTAKHLGISRATLFRKLKKYGFSRQVTTQA